MNMKKTVKTASFVAAIAFITAAATIVMILPGCGKKSGLHTAAWDGNIEMAKQAIAKGADLNAKAAMIGGGTPLHYAAYFGHDEIVELLIEAGAELNILDDKHGETPLDMAIRTGNDATADLLRKHGGKAVKS